MYDLIIVGAGPSGMTAAVYAARKKINALLISKNVGGQVITTGGIENYMGFQVIDGTDLMDKFEEQIKQFPIDQKIGEEVTSIKRLNGNFDLETSDGKQYQSRTVIMATGKTPRHLNVPGETKFLARGVSFCAICDGPLFAGEDVAVVGGGNSALEAIDDLLKIANRVYAITEAHFTGDAVLVERIKSSSKLFTFDEYAVKEITGYETVEGLTIKNLKTGELKYLSAKGIFVEIGLIPNSDPVKNLTKLNKSSEIEVNCNSETSTPGLFAAGDVASTPEKQIIVAAGEGAKAALEANRYLQRLG